MDIDIDFPSGFDPLKIFPMAVRASQVDERRNILVAHNVGIYLQDVPVDAQTKLAAAPYKLAEELGCFKIDCLPLHALNTFDSREDMLALLDEEPDWKLLMIPSVVQSLFHLGKQAELLAQVKPTSILELADVLALMRPMKRYILPYYLKNRLDARKLLYVKEDGEAFAFKKAHAISYAMIIVLQLHLIKAGIPL
jgi:hypothetical protein